MLQLKLPQNTPTKIKQVILKLLTSNTWYVASRVLQGLLLENFYFETDEVRPLFEIPLIINSRQNA